MARRKTYQELSEETARLDVRCHILEVSSGEAPDAVYRHRRRGDVYTSAGIYTWRAFRLTGAAGGYVVCHHAYTAGGGLSRFRRVMYCDRLDTLIYDVRDGARAWAEMGAAEAAAAFNTKRSALVTAQLDPAPAEALEAEAEAPAAARVILWALPKGETDRLHERPLTSMPLTPAEVARVRTAAAADGWHGFRTTVDDGRAPDFAAAVRS